MTIVTIDWPDDEESQNWFCPACGKQTFDSEEGLVVPPCPHLEFLYQPDLHEFEYINEKLKDLIEKERQAGDAEVDGEEEERDEISDDDDEVSDYELLEKALSRDSTFVTFELMGSNVACASISSTAYIGYRLFEYDF